MSDLPKQLRNAAEPYRMLIGLQGELSLMELAANEIERLTNEGARDHEEINNLKSAMGDAFCHIEDGSLHSAMVTLKHALRGMAVPVTHNQTTNIGSSGDDEASGCEQSNENYPPTDVHDQEQQ